MTPHVVLMLQAGEDEGAAAMNVQLSLDETYADITPVRQNPNSVSAFVSIMRGCNNSEYLGHCRRLNPRMPIELQFDSFSLTSISRLLWPQQHQGFLLTIYCVWLLCMWLSCSVCLLYRALHTWPGAQPAC
jgi:hypothetical protein